LITVLAREVVPRVRGKEKGDVLKWCERCAGEGIVGDEVGEGRDYGVALGGVVVGAGKDHVEFITVGVGGGSEDSGEVDRGRACGWSGKGIGG
jgi:hypothetical protein